MNKLTIAILTAAIGGATHATYTVKIPLPEDNVTFYDWVMSDPILGEWENTGDLHSCSNWSPSSSDITLGQSFTQTATDCKQNQIRTVQDREVDELSGSLRNIGEIYTQTQVITVSSTQEAVGSKESWVATTPTYTAWVNSGAVTSCTNWSPAPSTITVGQSFTQTATDCKQAQTRSRQNREQETTTKAIRDVGSPIGESQTITVSSTKTATGSKETWVATTPTYTAWVNSGAVTSCTNWSPAASTVASGQSFTQTATDCKQAQTRSRQNREQETTTKAIRNVGSPIGESQTLTVSATRTATGTKEVCQYKTTSMTPVLYNGVVNDSSTNHVFYWNGKTIGNARTTSLASGGFTYRASTLMQTISDDGAKIKYYQICRK